MARGDRAFVAREWGSERSDEPIGRAKAKRLQPERNRRERGRRNRRQLQRDPHTDTDHDRRPGQPTSPTLRSHVGHWIADHSRSAITSHQISRTSAP
jgi:hypothetical protein